MTTVNLTRSVEPASNIGRLRNRATSFCRSGVQTRPPADIRRDQVGEGSLMWHSTRKHFEIPFESSRSKKSSKKEKRTFLVSLSVKCSRGLREPFEYRATAAKRELAVQDAMQAAREVGLEPWVILDVVELHRGDELIGA